MLGLRFCKYSIGKLDCIHGPIISKLEDPNVVCVENYVQRNLKFIIIYLFSKKKNILFY
jgi:hypothetical protein